MSSELQSDVAVKAGDASQSRRLVAWQGPAMGIFVAAFALGAALIIYDVGQPYSPPALVLAYGLFVFMLRRAIVLTSEVKDSAYYLGFSLNLVFLVVAFRSYGAGLGTTPGQPASVDAVHYLVGTLGSAITATIAGLVARYGLYLADDDEDIQRKVFADIHGEVQRSVAEFHSTQQTFAQSVKAFVRQRESLVTKEEQTTGRYVAVLSGATKDLLDIQDRQLKNLHQLVVDCQPRIDGTAKIWSELLNRLHVMKAALDQVDPSTSLREVKGAADALRQALSDAGVKVTDLGTASTATTNALSSIAKGAPNLQDDLRAIDYLLSEFVRVAETRLRAIGHVALKPQ